ncbi:transglutaminase-like domain-containing protein [Acetobacteraceae bacterium KSS8]|uniref:Transglutaminase-like domain-containing protein n=1 Tax=Endosaccharibacter trunci TaxID=2812733 RepID=A0ABT1W7Y9_9PROT|nr:transglutaminase-like domain-containing protein [Acetobacteraceae bacterium KSS8]
MAEADEALAAIGVLPDAEIEPAMAALQLARLDAPDADWRRASDHVSELARDAAAIGGVMSGRPTEARIGALAGLLHARHAYRGDSETYDDLANANLIRVIERRRGLPVALGILWLHCVRAAGWEAYGIDFPGHFLLAVESEAPKGPRMRQPRYTLVDPFAQGITLGNARILSMLESRETENASIEPGVTRPMTTRGVLLRLQRNIVQRRLMQGELRDALGALEGMLLIAPEVVSNWLDAAELNRSLNRPGQAVLCLERILETAPDSEAARIARQKLSDLRRGGG